MVRFGPIEICCISGSVLFNLGLGSIHMQLSPFLIVSWAKKHKSSLCCRYVVSSYADKAIVSQTKATGILTIKTSEEIREFVTKDVDKAQETFYSFTRFLCSF